VVKNHEVGRYFMVSFMAVDTVLNESCSCMLSWNDFAVLRSGTWVWLTIALSLVISILLPTKLPRNPPKGVKVSDFTIRLWH
jgi:hypothetical protein